MTHTVQKIYARQKIPLAVAFADGSERTTAAVFFPGWSSVQSCNTEGEAAASRRTTTEESPAEGARDRDVAVFVAEAIATDSLSLPIQIHRKSFYYNPVTYSTTTSPQKYFRRRHHRRPADSGTENRNRSVCVFLFLYYLWLSNGMQRNLGLLCSDQTMWAVSVSVCVCVREKVRGGERAQRGVFIVREKGGRGWNGGGKGEGQRDTSPNGKGFCEYLLQDHGDFLNFNFKFNGKKNIGLIWANEISAWCVIW